MIAGTDSGREVSDSKRVLVDETLTRLEEQCSLSEPARSPLVEGRWTVLYTTSPPPSNGQLGPFRGVAQQEIDLTDGRYCNILRVPPTDWLVATLDATWEEWDGVFLQDDKDSTKESEVSLAAAVAEKATPPGDYGSTCWVVKFEQLSIALFGFTLFSQKFENTKRVWRTTYVDEDTRIVRAGRTGRRDDEMVFYMKRSP
mmetsp:Transcript_18677/g.31923  ORF Transcript_18677/g.31923 Transcript_18677/m.31923 type:complete len:200 (-) Transcript_18677:167-766(-)